MSDAWVLSEMQWVDSDVGAEQYEIGKFTSKQAARDHMPIYAAQRGQVVESIDFLLEQRTTSA